MFPCHLVTTFFLLLRVYFYFDLASADLKLCWCGELSSVLWWQGAFSSNSIDRSPRQKQFPQGVEQQRKNPLQLLTKQNQPLNDCKAFFFFPIIVVSWSLLVYILWGISNPPSVHTIFIMVVWLETLGL